MTHHCTLGRGARTFPLLPPPLPIEEEVVVCNLALCFGGGPVCLDEDEEVEVMETGEGERDVEGEEDDLLGLGGGWVVDVREEDPVDVDLFVVCPSPMLKKSTI